MKERPILFGAPMVRALLAGTKTQTRRPYKTKNGGIQPNPNDRPGMAQILRNCPYGQPGDQLWVRENFCDLLGTGVEHRPDVFATPQRYAFAADCPTDSYNDVARKDYGLKWKPSIHMPRAASRITLEVTGVRVERLQDISEADCIAEGCTQNANGYYWGGPHAVSGLKQLATAKGAYRDLWESINGPGSWDANPWVWVVEFKRTLQDSKP